MATVRDNVPPVREGRKYRDQCKRREENRGVGALMRQFGKSLDGFRLSAIRIAIVGSRLKLIGNERAAFQRPDRPERQ